MCLQNRPGYTRSVNKTSFYNLAKNTDGLNFFTSVNYKYNTFLQYFFLSAFSAMGKKTKINLVLTYYDKSLESNKRTIDRCLGKTLKTLQQLIKVDAKSPWLLTLKPNYLRQIISQALMITDPSPTSFITLSKN